MWPPVCRGPRCQCSPPARGSARSASCRRQADFSPSHETHCFLRPARCAPRSPAQSRHSLHYQPFLVPRSRLLEYSKSYLESVVPRSHSPGAAIFLFSKNPSRTCNIRKTRRSSCNCAAANEPNIAGNTERAPVGPRAGCLATPLLAPSVPRLPAVPFLVVLRTHVYSTSGVQGKAKPDFPGGSPCE